MKSQQIAFLTRNEQGISKFRIWLMRGLYTLTFVGLAFQAWKTLLYPEEPLLYLEGVAFSFWAAYATLMGLGILFPLRMLPLIFLQLAYKGIWAIWVYLPMEAANMVTPQAASFYNICLTAVVLDVLVIPWRHVFKTYRPKLLKKE
ncbi:MAG: hypothetical protein AAGD88_11600 [Bacteroidota bacterium]